MEVVSEKKKGTMKKRFSLKSIFKIIKIIALIFLLVIIMSIAYEQISRVLTANNHAPVGKMVDIGEYKLHMYATGKKSQLPTVVLESGLGTPSSYEDWRFVQPELSKVTRVISYDRAGYGWSDEAPNERTAEQLVEDLHTMLEKSGEKGPFLMVGHSFGGMISRMFVSKYPEESAGMVLVDSSHVDQELEFSKWQVYMAKVLKETGIIRIAGDLGFLPIHEKLSSQDIAVDFFYNKVHNANQTSELLNMMTKTANQVRKAEGKGFGNLPVFILSSANTIKEYPEWLKLQQSMTSWSTSSQNKIVSGSGHFIQLDQPNIIIESAKNILNQKQ
ncbi:alpha/beta hydrolase [Ectobacillus panaciterrae]|uniref:alpha/beta hydrolase n=1 Tax=Ectobacillus panaciterrae TaxID=363872 RepID=UPI0004296061|nr:alpha/beta fold hydrolase [Ectobacillus panaciterrae]